MEDEKNELTLKKLELAKQYLEDAKKDLKKARIDKRANRYIHSNYVSSACEKAYLGALEALKALFIYKNSISENEMEKIKEFYRGLKEMEDLGEIRDLLLGLFDDVYNILHLGSYYGELQNKKAIDSGFEKVKKIIKIVENYVK
ncbi:MAG: DUF5618 family protein [candidate division WOR-3 bacterium]